MSENIYDAPKSDSLNGQNYSQRSLIARILFSILWLIPIIILVQMLVGGVVGGMAGAGTGGFEAGKTAGEAAANEFFSAYGLYVFLGEILLWIVLCFFGKLPGTSKLKKVTS